MAKLPDHIIVLYEVRLEFSDYVPGGFGTADCLVINTQTGDVWVVDLKYGKGVQVFASSYQPRLYALGVLQTFGPFYDLKRFHLCIAQPRLDHIDEETVTLEELEAFGEEVSHAADLALSKHSPATPGEKQCRFCRARFSCSARSQQNLATAQAEFAKPADLITPEELAEILPQLKEIEKWCKDLQQHALELGLAGRAPEGYKVVHGRTHRRWAEGAAELLTDALGDDAWTKELIGIPAAEKLLGKKHEIFAGYTVKNAGAPVLVPLSDKRPPINDVAADFAD